MKCSKIQIKLSAFLDGELSDQEKKTLSEHLDNCPDCQSELEALRDMKLDLEQVKGVTAPPYFYTRLKQRLYDETAVPFPEKLRRFSVPAFATAFTILSIILGSTMARTIYQGISHTRSTTETANVFGVDAFDQYPEGSLSDIYTDLVQGGGQ